MSKLIGRLKSVGVGVETTSGTAVTPTFWVPDMDCSHQDKNTKDVDRSTYGRIQEANDARMVQQRTAGPKGGRQAGRAVEKGPVGRWGRRNGRQDERGVDEDHQENEAQEERVQPHVGLGSAACRPEREPSCPRDRQPGVSRE